MKLIIKNLVGKLEIDYRLHVTNKHIGHEDNSKNCFISLEFLHPVSKTFEFFDLVSSTSKEEYKENFEIALQKAQEAWSIELLKE